MNRLLKKALLPRWSMSRPAKKPAIRKNAGILNIVDEADQDRRGMGVVGVGVGPGDGRPAINPGEVAYAHVNYDTQEHHRGAQQVEAVVSGVLLRLGHRDLDDGSAPDCLVTEFGSTSDVFIHSQRTESVEDR